jgi:Rrf2 family protein
MQMTDWITRGQGIYSLDLFFIGAEMISKKTKYALKAMQYLAIHSENRPVLIAELATAENIPKKFLEFILLSLRKGGLLTSKIGRGGGYRLAREPAEITIGNLVTVLEGGFSLVYCLDGGGLKKCEDGNDPSCCGIHLAMVDVKKNINSILETTTLADIISKKDSAHKVKANIIDYSI